MNTEKIDYLFEMKFLALIYFFWLFMKINLHNSGWQIASQIHLHSSIHASSRRPRHVNEMLLASN